MTRGEEDQMIRKLGMMKKVERIWPSGVSTIVRGLGTGGLGTLSPIPQLPNNQNPNPQNKELTSNFLTGILIM